MLSIISKIKDFFKSFRNKVIVIIALIVVVSALLISKFVLNTDSSSVNTNKITENTGDNLQVTKVDIEQLKIILSPGIDSVLRNFGIKNEWISNPADEKNQKKGSKIQNKDAELFVKNVLIPAELSSIEVNADVSSYLKSLGLNSAVNEDIITKDVILSVLNSDTTAKLPLAKINIIHSEKVHRQSAIICVIINNITEYKPEDVDKLLLNKSEFSYVFPRNLDEIDLQNKLMHGKKDVIINMTIGGRENYETDFNASMDEKAIHERVKSFSVDFPTVSSIILTKKDNDIPPQLVAAIANDFGSYKIKVIYDESLTRLLTKAEEEAKDNVTILASNLKNKGSLAKTIITSVAIDKDDFGKFYDEILTLKKLGYKFYNFSDYSAKKETFEKEEQLKNEKANLEKQKKDEEKKIADKKAADKKKQTDKKSLDKKKLVEKKLNDKKPTDKKKTETGKPDNKKKTDVKKKK